jgi:hypothetical protein
MECTSDGKVVVEGAIKRSVERWHHKTVHSTAVNSNFLAVVAFEIVILRLKVPFCYFKDAKIGGFNASICDLLIFKPWSGLGSLPRLISLSSIGSVGLNAQTLKVLKFFHVVDGFCKLIGFYLSFRRAFSKLIRQQCYCECLLSKSNILIRTELSALGRQSLLESQITFCSKVNNRKGA